MIQSLQIDPRTKLTIVLLLSTLSLIYNNLYTLLIILTVSVILSFLMKRNVISMFLSIRKLLPAMIAIALIQSIFNKSGNPLFSLGKAVMLTDTGIIRALEFLLRLTVIIVSASIITTSSSREIIQGLVQWKCPYEIAFMTSIAIRFLPVFKEEMSDIVTAVQLRGIDLQKVRLNEKLKIYKYILTPIVINSVLKAKELSAAMEMRGFRAYPCRTSYMILKMKRIDYIIIGLCLGVVVFVIIQRGA
ncbi:energy-coupling factor transporter transmembrane component T [Sedimentibacter sp.]|uniref:energy-coupling factor transporter transmembrane component T family protein n=1 Tax=Sedimentibacter sp. TaxID=1960295 RepID=UPI00289CDB1D|nr:energy-coupling factor transporter transmembrane component T [Sedimentibacter sp.]